MVLLVVLAFMVSDSVGYPGYGLSFGLRSWDTAKKTAATGLLPTRSTSRAAAKYLGSWASVVTSMNS